jgi:hypothetical protein
MRLIDVIRQQELTSMRFIRLEDKQSKRSMVNGRERNLITDLQGIFKSREFINIMHLLIHTCNKALTRPRAVESKSR